MLTQLGFSPEDQAILEAEYKANPKPDKAARLEIVRKVSLGEKAVQVSVHEESGYGCWRRVAARRGRTVS